MIDERFSASSFASRGLDTEAARELADLLAEVASKTRLGVRPSILRFSVFRPRLGAGQALDFAILNLLSAPPLNDTLITRRSEALRDLWLSGRSPGLTSVSRLLNLAVLLHASAQEDDLKTVIAELRGASTALPTRYTIERSIARLMEHEDAK